MIGCLIVALVLTVVLAAWTWQLLKAYRDHSLGFRGERVVGEELNRLMLDGCRVFHDLPMAKVGNLDHVVVAPHAVIVVETKASVERKSSRAGDSYALKDGAFRR